MENGAGLSRTNPRELLASLTATHQFVNAAMRAAAGNVLNANTQLNVDRCSQASNSPLSILLEYTPETAEAKQIDYRGEKVAAFEIDGEIMICLPQAYELFLKNLVGGLHTVYTKLKRLEITPFVCNVEQVRALRSIGAIQPGVNRCKLINCRDFDLLYDDCASSNSRPGRPPKRSPIFPSSASTTNGASSSTIASGHALTSELPKRLRLGEPPAMAFDKLNGSSTGAFLPMSGLMNANTSLSSNQLFPLFPPQLMITHLANQSAMLAKQWNELNSSGGCVNYGADPGHDATAAAIATGSVGRVEGSISRSSSVNFDQAVNLSAVDNGLVDAGKQAETALQKDAYGRVKDETEDNGSSADDAESFQQQPINRRWDQSFGNGTEASQLLRSMVDLNMNMFGGSLLNPGAANLPLGGAGAASGSRPVDTNSRRKTCAASGRNGDCSSTVDGILANVQDLVELAANSAKKHEEQRQQEKQEHSRQMETAKQERQRLESLLHDAQRLKATYMKRLCRERKEKLNLQERILQLLEELRNRDQCQQQNRKSQTSRKRSATDDCRPGSIIENGTASITIGNEADQQQHKKKILLVNGLTDGLRESTNDTSCDSALVIDQ